MNIKCSAIYYQQSTTHNSLTSGTGIGLTSEGPGIGFYGGSTVTHSKSELAEMFSPIKNEIERDEGWLFNLLIGTFTLMIGSKADSAFFKVEGLNPLFLQILMIGVSVFCFAQVFHSLNGKAKYSKEEMNKIEDNYQKVYYNPQEHSIFIDESKKVPATRENFVKLVQEPYV